MKTIVYRANPWRWRILFFSCFLGTGFVLEFSRHGFADAERLRTFFVPWVVGSFIGLTIAEVFRKLFFPAAWHDIVIEDDTLKAPRRNGFCFVPETVALSDLDLEQSRCSWLSSSYIKTRDGRRMAIDLSLHSMRDAKDIFRELRGRMERLE